MVLCVAGQAKALTRTATSSSDRGGFQHRSLHHLLLADDAQHSRPFSESDGIQLKGKGTFNRCIVLLRGL